MASEPPPPSALVDFIAGTAAGVASLLAGHPFDTIKTRLQAQSHSHSPSSPSPSPSPSPSASASASSSRLADTRPLLPKHALAHAHTIKPVSSRALTHASTPIYRNATHAFHVIVRQERFIGLYKGVTSPLLGVAIMNASIFGLYGLALRYQQHHNILGDPSPTLSQIMVAGMLSGLGSSLITAPIDLVKIRQQMDVSHPRTSTYRLLLSILANEGLFRGLFRGWGATAIRDLGYGPYFWSYELLNRLVSRIGLDPDAPAPARARPLSNAQLAVSGGIAGVLAWLSTFWADVVKTRVQATSHLDDRRAPGSPFWHRSLFLRTAASTYAEGGIAAFFAGVGPTVLRALPVNAVMFIVFESVRDSLVAYGL